MGLRGKYRCEILLLFVPHCIRSREHATSPRESGSTEIAFCQGKAQDFARICVFDGFEAVVPADLNPQSVPGTRPQSVRVYQFRHGTNRPGVWGGSPALRRAARPTHSGTLSRRPEPLSVGQINAKVKRVTICSSYVPAIVALYTA